MDRIKQMGLYRPLVDSANSTGWRYDPKELGGCAVQMTWQEQGGEAIRESELALISVAKRAIDSTHVCYGPNDDEPVYACLLNCEQLPLLCAISLEENPSRKLNLTPCADGCEYSAHVFGETTCCILEYRVSVPSQG